MNGVLLRQPWPVHDAAEWLSGQGFDPENAKLPCTEFYYLLGFGPRQIYSGAAQYKHHLHCTPKLRLGQHKEWAAAWDAEHPAFVQWRTDLTAQMRRDGHVVNPYGRWGRFRIRAKETNKGTQYSCPEGQRFMLLSTAMDALKDAVVRAGVRPLSVAFGQVRVATARDAQAVLESVSHIRLEK